MELQTNHLSEHLKKKMAKSYLLFGEELLLIQESADLIRQAARETGYLERQRIIIDKKDDWQQLKHCNNNLSLFADRKLIEVLLPSGKPGIEGSKTILEYLDSDQENILLIISGKIDKQSRKSKWYMALDRAGILIPVWPITASEMPRWLTARLANAGLTAESDAIKILSEYLEGNLVAAAQEIEKLSMADNGCVITAKMITETTSDNARYNVFRLLDYALSGDARAAIRALRALKTETIQPPQILWVMAREIQLIISLKQDIRNGATPSTALINKGVWRNRQALLRSALNRLSFYQLSLLQELAFQVDGSTKGYLLGSPWQQLETMLLLIAQGPSADKIAARHI